MNMETQEVVSSAIKLEEDGIEFYEEAASRTANKLVRQMFHSLADDERDHIKWIQDNSPGGMEPAAVSEKYRTLLKGIFRQDSGDIKDVAKHTDSDMEAANSALEIERKSVKAYENWAEDAQDEQIRELCNKIRDFEQFHYKVLQNMITYMERPGDWFMEEEQWNFEGG